MNKKTLRNVLVTPGFIVRVPLVLGLWFFEWLRGPVEWLLHNVFVGWER